MTRALLLAALFLTGCHSGPVGAAGISASVSLVGILNQEWLNDKLPFLKLGAPKTVTTDASATTSAVTK